MSTIRFGLIGSSGRMGTALREYLPSCPDIELTIEVNSLGRLGELLESKPDVVVDLSNGPAVDTNAITVIEAGIPYVLGATGYKNETLRAMEQAAADYKTPVLIVPNFSLGANLMILFAQQAAKLMHSPTVIERHHQGKADAPSGTALFTAKRIAAARPNDPANRPSTAAQFHDQSPGSLGSDQDGVAVHALRGAGYLADQEVSFCLPGEALRIEHRSIDRRCFMPGVAYAIRNIGRVTGLQIGLDTILDNI